MQDEKRVTVKVPGDLHKLARVKAAQEGVVISDLVREWLQAWIAGELVPGLESSGLHKPMFVYVGRQADLSAAMPGPKAAHEST